MLSPENYQKLRERIANIIKRIFCKHKEWAIQPSYAELYYDKCLNCGKYRETVGEIQTTKFNLGTWKLK